MYTNLHSVHVQVSVNIESVMYAHIQYKSVGCVEEHGNETGQTSTSNLMSRQNYLLGLNGPGGF